MENFQKNFLLCWLEKKNKMVKSLKDLLKKVVNPTIQQLLFIGDSYSIKQRLESGEAKVEELNPLMDDSVTKGRAEEVKILAELGANLEFINELRKTPANIGLEKGDKR